MDITFVCVWCCVTSHSLHTINFLSKLLVDQAGEIWYALGPFCGTGLTLMLNESMFVTVTFGCLDHVFGLAVLSVQHTLRTVSRWVKISRQTRDCVIFFITITSLGGFLRASWYSLPLLVRLVSLTNQTTSHLRFKEDNGYCVDRRGAHQPTVLAVPR